MLRDELKRSRVEQLFAAADRLAAQDLPALTEAEVEQEIQAARAQRRCRPCERSLTRTSSFPVCSGTARRDRCSTQPATVWPVCSPVRNCWPSWRRF